MVLQMFSVIERSRLQVGQLNIKTLPLQSHGVVTDTVCSLLLSCRNMQGLNGSIGCSKTSIYLPVLMRPVQSVSEPPEN